MDFSIESDINILLSISKKNQITVENAKSIAEIINRYFNLHQRNQSFKQVEEHISKRFDEILSHFDLHNGTKFASAYFLFCYTLIDHKKGFNGVQNDIYYNVAVPFQNWVQNKASTFQELISTIPLGEVYVFICRRATVKGLYAPGKSIYTYAEALLARGESVWIIALFNSEPQFTNLKKKFKKLRISVLFKAQLEMNLVSVIEILKLGEPKVILTEIEFDLAAIIGILNKKVPIIYLSQGFYNLPWYNLIGISSNIDQQHQGRSKNDFFALPVWVNRNILAPEIDLGLIHSAKDKLGIKENDFVIGAFDRMEKYTDQFLKFIFRLLEKDKRIKVLLAGPNDQTKVITKLKSFIAERRAIILGFVDVDILGHCIDLGIDTFPVHSGFSVLELMAKNIPVISRKDEFSTLRRLPETTREDENELENLVIKLLNDSSLLESYKKKTEQFMTNQDQSSTFLKTLDEKIIMLKQHL